MSLRKLSFVVIIIFLLSTDLLAIRSRKDYFLKPQIGLWFGPITPVYTTNEAVDTDIGVGLFARYNTPLRLLKIGLDFSYQNYDSQGVNELTVMPVYGSLIFLLPLNIFIK